LPVWKRPPVSVANGFCHPFWTGSRVKLSHPTGSLPIRRGPRLARDDTTYSLRTCFGGTIPPFHLSTFSPQKHLSTFPPFLIRVNLCNLWMIILKGWIPGQATPPNRYALWRGPRLPGMTQCGVWFDLYFGWTLVPYSIHLICVNLCNLWMIILKGWITDRGPECRAVIYQQQKKGKKQN